MSSDQCRKTIGQAAPGPGAGALAAPELPSEILPSAAIAAADSQLVNTGEVNGAQRWAAPDQSLVQYRRPGER